MNTRILLFSFLCSLVALPATRAADDGHGHGDKKHTELGEHMEQMGGAFRRLSRQINDASRNEDSLKLVATIRKNADAGLTLEPEKTADLPEDRRAAFVADYRETLKAFIGELDKLAASLEAGNNTEAAQQFEKLKQGQKDAHKEFQKKK